MGGFNPLEFFNNPLGYGRANSMPGINIPQGQQSVFSALGLQDTQRDDDLDQLIKRMIGERESNGARAKLMELLTQSPQQWAEQRRQDFLQRSGGTGKAFLSELMSAMASGDKYVPVVERERASAMKDYQLQTERLQHAADMQRADRELNARLVTALNAEKDRNSRGIIAMENNQQKALDRSAKMSIQESINAMKQRGFDETRILTALKNHPMIKNEDDVWEAIKRVTGLVGVGPNGEETMDYGNNEKWSRAVQMMHDYNQKDRQGQPAQSGTRTTVQNMIIGDRSVPVQITQPWSKSGTPAGPTFDAGKYLSPTGGQPTSVSPTSASTAAPSGSMPAPPTASGPSGYGGIKILTGPDGKPLEAANAFNKERIEQGQRQDLYTPLVGTLMNEYSKWAKSGKKGNVGIARYSGTGSIEALGEGIRSKSLSDAMNSLGAVPGVKKLRQWTGTESPEEAEVTNLTDRLAAAKMFGTAGKALTVNELQFFNNSLMKYSEIKGPVGYLSSMLLNKYLDEIDFFRRKNGIVGDNLKAAPASLGPDIVKRVNQIIRQLDMGEDPKNIDIDSNEFIASVHGMSSDTWDVKIGPDGKRYRVKKKL